MAWQHITPQLTMKGCKFSAMDATDDDIVWNGSEEDGKLRS
jgi:hypothetical protein